MAFNNNASSAGQVLGASTIAIAGAEILPRTGSPITSFLAIVAIICGVIVLASFIAARVIRMLS